MMNIIQVRFTCAPAKYILKKSSLTWGMEASPLYGLGLKSAIAQLPATNG